MARSIGGGDNIMGSNEAIINVSFKDDLGNILENASKLKEILDAVNSNFLAINSAVGMTTNSMGKLASQTQRLVSTTQQLRNEYQIIADASQRIGLSSISGPSAAISAGPFSNTDVIQSALTGSGAGLILPRSDQDKMPIGSTAGLERSVLPDKPRFGRRNVFNASEREVYTKRINPQFDPQTGEEQPGKYVKAPSLGAALPGMMRDYQSGVSIPNILLKTIKTFAPAGGALSTIAGSLPYIGAIVGGAAALYKASDYLIKGATRYSGLTGGTGVYQNTGAAEGSQTFLGMQSRSWLEGLKNMAIGPGGYTQIQETLLGSGYTARDNANYSQLGIKGLRYETTRSALAELYKVGLQDVDANLQLMQLVAERGGGSLTTLMGTIDNLRKVALTTNASLKVMTQTMTTAIQGLVGGMGAAGGVAAFIGGNNATAYANAENSLLRGRGGPNYGDMITQMLIAQTPAAQSAGITFSNMFYSMAHPELFPQGLGTTIGVSTDQAVDNLLNMAFKVPAGADSNQAADIVRSNRSAVMAMMNNPMIQALAGPEVTSNVDAFIEWAATNLTSDPQTTAAALSREQNLSHEVDEDYFYRYGADSKKSGNTKYDRDFAVKRYLLDTFDQEDIDWNDTPGNKLRETKPITNAYVDYVQATGQAIGWAEKALLNPDGTTAARTYVKIDGETMTMQEFLEKAETDARYQAIARGEGDTTMLVGEMKQGGSVDDIKWMDAAEYGGGGSGGKTLGQLTQEELTEVIGKGIRKFNLSSEGLRVKYDW